jgi:hypothetical protein
MRLLKDGTGRADLGYLNWLLAIGYSTEGCVWVHVPETFISANNNKKIVKKNKIRNNSV